MVADSRGNGGGTAAAVADPFVISGPAAPTAFARSGRAEELGKAALHVAMEALFASGEIEIAEERPPSRRLKFIQATGQ